MVTELHTTYLASFGIVNSIHPPLPLNFEVLLVVQKQIRRHHRASGEEMGSHPTLLIVVWRILVSKDVAEELAARLECPSNFCHELLVVLHVLKHLKSKTLA